MTHEDWKSVIKTGVFLFIFGLPFVAFSSFIGQIVLITCK
jgi:hypothetical protein